MKKLVFAFSFFVLSSYHYVQAQEVQDTIASFSVPVVKLKPIEYIELYKDIALREMEKYRIPASITLAQGLLESSNGNSTLARIAKNHFGIKCPGGWTGESVFQDDDAKNECFRAYDSAEESFRDHSDFLSTKKRYAFLFDLDINDYVSWANGLKKAGYATNPQYPDLLISLINRYQLYQYDPQGKRITNQADPFFTDEELEAIINLILPIPNDNMATYYKVRSGDSLFSISKKFALSIDDLKIINHLNSNNLYIGQTLKVNKD